MRSRNQRTNYGKPLVDYSPFERQASGKYFVDKLVHDSEAVPARWVVMSYGDSDKFASPGKELDKLIQRAEALEGTVRIRRSADDVIVWESPVPAPPAVEQAS